MTDERTPNLDERLADFTDRLMAGETAEQAAASDAGRELASLQETVEKALRAMRVPPPEAEIRNRIRTRLAAEWLEKGPPAQERNVKWVSSRERNRKFLLRLAAVAAVLAIAAVLVAPKIDTLLTGAAQKKEGLIIIGGIFLIVLLVILIWPTRKS